MAGLVPAIYAFRCGTKNVDGRDKPGHDVKRKEQCLAREVTLFVA
jgi:hypothetical protein